MLDKLKTCNVKDVYDDVDLDELVINEGGGLGLCLLWGGEAL